MICRVDIAFHSLLAHLGPSFSFTALVTAQTAQKIMTRVLDPSTAVAVPIQDFYSYIFLEENKL